MIECKIQSESVLEETKIKSCFISSDQSTFKRWINIRIRSSHQEVVAPKILIHSICEVGSKYSQALRFLTPATEQFTIAEPGWSVSDKFREHHAHTCRRIEQMRFA